MYEPRIFSQGSLFISQCTFFSFKCSFCRIFPFSKILIRTEERRATVRYFVVGVFARTAKEALLQPAKYSRDSALSSERNREKMYVNSAIMIHAILYARRHQIHSHSPLKFKVDRDDIYTEETNFIDRWSEILSFM